LEQISWGNQPPPEPKDNPDCPILLDYQLFREQLADRWVSYQVEAIKKSDPDALVTVGLIQWSVPVVLPSVRQYAAFRPKRIAQWLDFLEIHFYPLAGGFYDYTRREDEKLNLAYLHSIVREAAAAGKPVVVAEFGWYGVRKLTINRGVHPPASQEQQARWCRLVIESTAGLATGWLNWGLFDQPEARDVSQLTGLLTADGQPKAWAREFQRLSEQYGRKGVEPAKIGPEPVLDWDRAIRSPKVGRQFLDQYMRQMPAAAAGSR
jgi:endo-1,4-beta-mannosidase